MMTGPTFWLVLLAGAVIGAVIVALAVAAHHDYIDHRQLVIDSEALKALKRIVIGVQYGWPKEQVVHVAQHTIHKLEDGR